MKPTATFFSRTNILPTTETECATQSKSDSWQLHQVAEFFDTGQRYRMRMAFRHIATPFRRSTSWRTGVRPQTSRIFYTTTKKEKEIGVITKNIVPKAVANRTPVFVRIAARPQANRTRSRTLTSAQFYSYLALNWQRTAAMVRNTSRDRRFPTPQPTTTHLFWPNQQRSATLLPPNWLRNPGPAAGEVVSFIAVSRRPNLLASKYTNDGEGGGGHADAVVESAIRIASRGNFATKGDPLFNDEHSRN